jgi:hypothetical protein
MTRWHEDDCRSPDVYVNNEYVPTCRACARFYYTTKSPLPNLKNTSPGITLPPDELPGQLNLSWPRDVCYVTQEIPEDSNTQNQSSPSNTPREDLSRLTIDARQSTNSHVYTRLRSDQFRLAFLTAAPTDDYPIHLNLETYTHENRPEYETVSYMWGGANGDSRPCQPIFIGPYWDVLHQSQNCWAMLRFVRPWRGTRMVWVDALCR